MPRSVNSLGFAQVALTAKFRSPHRRGLAEWAMDRTRLSVSRGLLRGQGLEIGALHWPLPVPSGASVRYVDRFDVEGLRAHYPELRDKQLVPVDVIDDGETLATQPDESQDFIIANHFLEHTEDPVRTIKNHLRVLRGGGHLYLAVPMKDATFDVLRPVTPLAHILHDHANGPEGSRTSHYEEWARQVDKVPEDEVDAKVSELLEQQYSIHFHVWDEPAFLSFIGHLENELGLPMRVVLTRRNRHELIVIAEKVSQTAAR